MLEECRGTPGERMEVGPKCQGKAGGYQGMNGSGCKVPGEIKVNVRDRVECARGMQGYSSGM